MTIHCSAQAIISKGFVYVSGNIGCTNDFQIVEGGVQGQTVSSYFLSLMNQSVTRCYRLLPLKVFATFSMLQDLDSNTL